MDQQTSRVLLSDNPWLEGAALEPWLERLIPPDFVPRRLRLRADHRVCLVVGPRQAGKSTLIWRTLAEDREPCLYLSCEEPSIAHWLESPALFLSDLATVAPRCRRVFLEEVQRLPEAGLFLKGLVDRRAGLEVFATGSSSFDLEAGTRESLAGRASRHLLLPLSLAEERARLSESAAVVEARMPEIVERQLVLGSYPRVVTGTSPRGEIAALVEAFIVRDMSDRFSIRHPAALRKLLELASSQVGNLVSFSEWGAHLALNAGTVAEYARLLEETHVLRLVRPFVGGKRAEVTSATKVFFLDNGVRNQLFGGFADAGGRGDIGPLLENLVFAELAKYLNPILDGLSYWRSRSGAEVDFVVTRSGRVAGVEVKATAIPGRLSRSASSFLEAYRPEVFLVANLAARGEMERHGVRVLFVRPWELAETLLPSLPEG